ncbi:MAG TPA: endonuclease III [Gemmatimonadaceae bacterium]|nr:endonuclease III [Gemmatimonadaceae bacterium]
MPVAAPKKPHRISVMLRRIADAVAPFAPAAMFALAERGHRSLFEQLVACIVSIRTRDEVMLAAAERLFARARTPEAVAALGVAGIDALIRTSSFHEAKARQIHAIAVAARDEHGGTLPCDAEVLTAFGGVGPKCANLALGIACGQARIGVDVHVHRVTNRWGYVSAPTPEKTMLALERKLPRAYWVEINRLLVPFGKHICTGVRPKCSECPVLAWCRQVGVTEFR